jgi:hypothetical protein
MTTCEPLCPGGGEPDEELTLFAAGSLASPSPSRVKGRRRVINGGSGLTSRMWFASYDPGTWSWRMFQGCLDGEWVTFSGTWPVSGMTRTGIACRLRPSVPHIYETGSSSLPTPAASAYGSNQGGGAGREGQPSRPSLETMARHDLWPTPKASAANYGQPRDNDRGDLQAEVLRRMWPTPTASDGTGGRVSSDPGGLRPSGKKKHVTLATAANHWPTPTASCVDIDTMERQRYSREQLGQMRDDGQPYETQASGMLNPAWVGWLMGFPAGWTSCEDSGTR